MRNSILSSRAVDSILTDVPGEVNLFVSFECLKQFSFEGLESYFKIQFSTRFLKTSMKEITQRRCRSSNFQ